MRLFTRIESCDDRQRLQFLVLALIQKKIPAIVLSDQEYIIRYEIFNKQELKLNDQVYINEIPNHLPVDRQDDEEYENLLKVIEEIYDKYKKGMFIEGKWCMIDGFILYYTVGMFVALDFKLFQNQVLVLKTEED